MHLLFAKCGGTRLGRIAAFAGLFAAAVLAAMPIPPAYAGTTATTTTVDPQSTVFSGAAQNVTLSATVTNTGSGAPVTSGQVTFQVKNGMTNVGTAVTDTALDAFGVASVTYSLPGGTGPGPFTIEGSYTDFGVSFQDSMGTNTLTVDPASVTFAKAFTPDTIGPGSTSTLVFTIDNSAGGTVTGLAFTDTLPAGMTIATPSSAFTDCVDGVLSAPDGGGTISLTDGGVGAANTCIVSVNVTAGAIDNSDTTYMNISGDLTSSAGNSGTASDDLFVDVDRPGFSKSFAPGSLPLGSRSTLTFTIDNTANAVPIDSLNFTDTLPPGMTIASPANASTDCTFVSLPVLTAPAGGTAVSFSFGGVDTGATCTVTVDVIGGAAGILQNVSGDLLSGDGFFNPVVSSGSASAALDVTIEPLQLIKSFTDDPVAPGGTVTLEFTILNGDRIDSATAIAFTDDLTALVPAITGLTATSVGPNTCAGSTVDISTPTLVDFSGGTLPPEGTCTFSVDLTVPGGATLGFFTNTTSAITGDIGGSGVIGNTASDDLFVQPVPLLTKSFTDDPVGAGDDVTLEFTITNQSTTGIATDIAFIDELTTFLPFPVSVTLPPTPCGPSSLLQLVFLGDEEQGLSLTGGDLATSGSAGDSCTFSAIITIPPGQASGTFTNTTGEITATIGGTIFTGNPASDDLVVVGGPQLSKEFTDDPVAPGGTVTLDFTLTHDALAAGNASGVTFTDDLAALVPVVAGLTATGLPLNDVCGAGNGSLTGSLSDTFLTFSGATLTPGQICSFSVTLDVPVSAPSGSFTNTTSDVSATVSGIAVTAPPVSDDLRISSINFTKEFTDDPANPGGTTTLLFTIENTSTTDDATDIVFTDDLGGGSGTLTGLAATALPANGTCGAGSSMVGTTFLIFTGGDLAPGASCTQSVTLQVPAGAAPDTYPNTTSNLTTTIGGTPAVLDPASDNLVIESAAANVVLSKEFTDDPTTPGGTPTLEFTITNSGADATLINFTDDLDATLTGLEATVATANTCGGMAAGFPTGLFDYSGGTLLAGQSCTISLTLLVPVDALSGTFINTTSDLEATVNGLIGTSDPATDDLTVISAVTPILLKSFSPDPIAVDGTVDLTFTISNPAAGNALLDLSFSDDLAAIPGLTPGLLATGLPLTEACDPDGPGGSPGTGTLSGTSLVVFTGGSLAAGANCEFTVPVKVPAMAPIGTFTNTTSSLREGPQDVAGPAVATLTILGSGFGTAGVAVTGTSSGINCIGNTIVGFATATVGCDFEVGTKPSVP